MLRITHGLTRCETLTGIGMPLGAAGPVQMNALNYAPVWLRGNGNLLVAQDAMSIVEYEPASGNSVIRSL